MKRILFVALVAIIATGATGCGAIQQAIPGPAEAVITYNTLIALYQGAQLGASNAAGCIDTNYAKTQIAVQLNDKYLDTDKAKVEAWRKVLAQRQGGLDSMLNAYKQTGGDPSKLDLKTLADSGALPTDLASGFSLYVNAFTEAPLAPTNPDVTLAAMKTSSEAMNSIQQCVVDWNKAVNAYNVGRNQAKGDIVGQVAQALHVKELPESLPYYQGGNSGPIRNPVAPTTVPPTPVK